MENELLSLAKLAKLLPATRGDKPPSRNTLYRWATAGLVSRSGQPIRLRTEFIGGVLCSTLADVRRLGEAKADTVWQPPEESGRDRELAAIRKRGEEAMRKLRRDGVRC